MQRETEKAHQLPLRLPGRTHHSSSLSTRNCQAVLAHSKGAAKYSTVVPRREGQVSPHSAGLYSGALPRFSHWQRGTQLSPFGCSFTIGSAASYLHAHFLGFLSRFVEGRRVRKGEKNLLKCVFPRQMEDTSQVVLTPISPYTPTSTWQVASKRAHIECRHRKLCHSPLIDGVSGHFSINLRFAHLQN